MGVCTMIIEAMRSKPGGSVVDRNGQELPKLLFYSSRGGHDSTYARSLASMVSSRLGFD
jgi:hypothetical protein